MDVHQSPQKSETSAVISNPEIIKLGESLITKADSMSVNLIPLKNSETIESLRQIFPSKPLCVCDFYIETAESWQRVIGGMYNYDADILNIDHHAPHEHMYRFISSGNLAAEYVRAHGITDRVLINNHTDCDSVISRLIMGGEIPPLEIFEKAVIAADHTGEQNPIADMLQAIDIERNLAFSTRNLGLLLANLPLDKRAAELLDDRNTNRISTEQLIAAGDVEFKNKLAIVQMDGKMRNEFIPPLLPQAALILTFEPGTQKNDYREIARLRLGNDAPEGFTIFDLSMDELDPSYGGRWNAGSNKRGGGCKVSQAEYTTALAEALDRALQKY